MGSTLVIHERLYLIGGYAACECATPDMNRMYDSASDTWEYKATIPHHGFSWGHATAVVNDQIFVIGGKSGNEPDPKVLRYDPTNDTWSGGLSPIPINFEKNSEGKTFKGLAAGTIAGKIYVVGTGEHLQIYDPEADNWAQGGNLPVPMSSPSVAVLNGELYVFGGTTDWTKGGNLSSVQIYDPEIDQWRLSIDDLSAPRYFSAAAIHDGSVYVFGGHGRERRILDLNEKLLLPRP